MKLSGTVKHGADISSLSYDPTKISGFHTDRPADAGKRVYAIAAWTSPRGELGPPSVPLLIAGTLSLAA